MKRKTGNTRIRLVHRQKNRLSIKQKHIWIASTTLSLFVIISLTIFFQFSKVEQSYAAVSGDYRSKQSGSWNTAAVWETYNGTAWVNAASSPKNTNNIINIQTGHIISITANVKADQLIINSGGEVDVISGNTLTISNGTGNDLEVNGIIANEGAITLSPGSVVNINQGGFYKHNRNAGTIPIATWNTGSTCEILGVTTSKPVNLNQSFYNVTWNSINQTASALDLTGSLLTINGDLTITSTGTGEIMFGKTQTFTISIGGNYYHKGGNVYATRTSCIINLAGNFMQTGGTLYASDAASAGAGNYLFTMNVTGDFSMSGGSFVMSQYTGSTAGKGIGKLNLSGNISLTGGTITETANTSATRGYGDIYFIKTGVQTFTDSIGSITNNVNFIVNAGSTLNLGTSRITGSGNFTMLAGGGIYIGSPDGISASAAIGNILVTGTRTLNSSCDYIYNGNGNQSTGDGIPSMVSNIIINNNNTLALAKTVTVTGALTMTSGRLVTGSKEIVINNASVSSISGYSSNNYIIGNLRRQVNSSGSYDFPVGNSSNYELININLTGAVGPANILANFTTGNPINDSFPLSGIIVNGNPIDTLLDHGYWTITPNNAMTSGTYTITLKETGHSEHADDGSSYCVLKRANSSSSWSAPGTTNAADQSELNGVATAVMSNLTSFSQFAIGKKKGIIALPIKLLFFKAKLNNDKVDFTWATAAEINNDYFTVERSPDGINFEPLLKKPGAGNSTVTLYYSDEDPQPLSGVSYYRLKQTDYDDHFSYSEIKSVKNNSKKDLETSIKIVSVAPNPFSENFTVNFSVKTSGLVDFQIINSSGQAIFLDKINAREGINEHLYTDEKGLPPGIYFMILVSNDEKIVQKLIKK